MTEDKKTAASADAAAPAAKRKDRRKLAVVAGVVCAVVVVAGAGFWVWHEQPSFCNATYDGEPGQAGLDKWGNPVDDMGDLMVVQHKQAGLTCLSCHEPTLGQQITEGLHWVSGDFEYPLDERSLTDLNHYLQKDDPESFCLNENCHNMTRDDLAQATSALGERNPHVTEVRHEQIECGECHKSHRQSVNACSRCHDDAPIPEGWLDAHQAAQLDASGFPY